MGAEPGEAHVALALPAGFDTGCGARARRGMEELAARLGVTIAGGDVITAASPDGHGVRDGLGAEDAHAGRPRRRAARR